MSDAVPVSITILDKEYVVSCPAGEEQHLREAARVLGERMAQAREGSKTLGAERIAVVTALNVVHELLGLQRQQATDSSALEADVARIEDKVRTFLGRRSAAEGVD